MNISEEQKSGKGKVREPEISGGDKPLPYER